MPSSTAQSVAMARAHLTRMGVIDDPYAEEMLRLPWRAATAALRLPGLRSRGTSPTFAYLAVRTMFFDAAILHALDDGVQRVVVVGAGYDSRAWRLARPGVDFIEIDHPDTQADKRRRAPRGGPHYMPLDLAVQPIPPCAAGAEPAIAVVEGVTMYLKEQHVARLLGSLAARGNRLVVNFGVGGGKTRPSRRAVRAAASAGGEAFRFEPTRANAMALLERTGWSTGEVVTGRELANRYLSHTTFPADLTDDALLITALCG
jgi:methyltransferase (TIGR00027 family)